MRAGRYEDGGKGVVRPSDCDGMAINDSFPSGIVDLADNENARLDCFDKEFEFVCAFPGPLDFWIGDIEVSDRRGSGFVWRFG